MWSKALEMYTYKLSESPEEKSQYEMGKLRCLRNLMDWENLSNLVAQMWDKEEKNKRAGKFSTQ